MYMHVAVFLHVNVLQQQYVFVHECLKHVLDERNNETTMQQNGDVGM